MAQVAVFSLGGLGSPCCCSGGGGGTCCLQTCGTIVVPHKDLTLTVSGGGAAGTYTLHYNGSSWSSDCISVLNGLFYLECIDDSLNFEYKYFLGADCTGTLAANCIPGGLFPNGFIFVSYNNSPFSYVVNDICTAGLDMGTNAYYCFLDNGITPCTPVGATVTYTIADGSPVTNPPGLMCQCFTITGCGAPLVGAGLTIYASGGSPELASGTTNADGVVCVAWQGSPGTYDLSLTYPGFSFTDESYDLSCDESTAIDVGSDPADAQCCNECALPNTLYITDSEQTTTLTWSATLSAWIGCYQLTVGEGAKYLTVGALHTCSPDTQVSILYSVVCGGDGGVTITRTWYYCNIAGTGTYCWNEFDGSCNVTTSGTHVACPFTCTDTGTIGWTTCSPLALSGTLTLGTCGSLTSPLTDAVSMSS
jgi:hypothetical protein